MAAMALAGGGVAWAGCGDDNGSGDVNTDEAGETLERGAEDAREGIEDGAEDAREGIEEGADDVREGVDEALDDAEDGTNDGGRDDNRP